MTYRGGRPKNARQQAPKAPKGTRWQVAVGQATIAVIPKLRKPERRKLAAGDLGQFPVFERLCRDHAIGPADVFTQPSVTEAGKAEKDTDLIPSPLPVPAPPSHPDARQLSDLGDIRKELDMPSVREWAVLTAWRAREAGGQRFTGRDFENIVKTIGDKEGLHPPSRRREKG